MELSKEYSYLKILNSETHVEHSLLAVLSCVKKRNRFLEQQLRNYQEFKDNYRALLGGTY